MQWVLPVVMAVRVLVCDQVAAQVRYLTDRNVFPSISTANTIYVDVQASSWKPRGRLLWDPPADIRAKLIAVGFEIVREKTQPHALTLTGSYEETRGRQFGINRYGTVLTGTFRIEHHEKGPLFEMTIQERAALTPSGTLPYLDSLHNFLTNPYYHFLGEIVDGQVHRNQDAHAVFLKELHANVARYAVPEVSDNPEWIPEGIHSMQQAHTLYEPVATRRTIGEFVQADDDRIVDILPDLLNHPDVYVKVRSVEVFGDFRVMEALPLLRDLEKNAKEIEVRNASSATISRLTGTSP
ncbi:MAG: HEAT repeat domain-containing protein [Nitrospira sp.]|nr:HEAT repeat domain-containing protein [Nitrospira sp.]